MTAEQETREWALAEAFVSLADTLVDEYDVIELLDRLSTDCVALLPVEAAGLLLSVPAGVIAGGVRLHRPSSPGGAVPGAVQ
jgi:hypothetical protein